jgi:hypothetical protein
MRSQQQNSPLSMTGPPLANGLRKCCPREWRILRPLVKNAWLRQGASLGGHMNVKENLVRHR